MPTDAASCCSALVLSLSVSSGLSRPSLTASRLSLRLSMLWYTLCPLKMLATAARPAARPEVMICLPRIFLVRSASSSESPNS